MANPFAPPQVNGVPACANGGLLNTIARDTFNFSGFVVSDYDAWEEMVSTHAWVSTYAEAAAAGLSAGLDQEGGGGPHYPPVQDGIPAALADGTVTLAQLERSVRRLMLARLRLGMFDPPRANPYNYITHASVASPEHLALAYTAAAEGMTLLKNDRGALPLKLTAGMRIALVGPNANASYGLLGSYSDPFCCTAGIPSLLDELSGLAKAAGATVVYAPGCVNAAGERDTNCASTSGFAAAAAAAASADATIVVIGMGNSQVRHLFQHASGPATAASHHICFTPYPLNSSTTAAAPKTGQTARRRTTTARLASCRASRLRS